MLFRKRRLIPSVIVGVAAALLTWLVIGSGFHFHLPEIAGLVLSLVLGPLLLPGIVAAMMVSGNVHNFSIWVVATGNFIFYFAVVHLLSAAWDKWKAKRHVE